MVSNVTEAIFEWAKDFEFGSKLKLNAVCENLGDRALITSVAERITTYIDNSQDKRALFSLVLVAPWSEGVDGLNLEAMEEGEAWLAWVHEQNRLRNFPVIENADVLEVDTDDETPVLVQVMPDTRQAKYQFQAHVLYRVKGN